MGRKLQDSGGRSMRGGGGYGSWKLERKFVWRAGKGLSHGSEGEKGSKGRDVENKAGGSRLKGDTNYLCELEKIERTVPDGGRRTGKKLD